MNNILTRVTMRRLILMIAQFIGLSLCVVNSAYSLNILAFGDSITQGYQRAAGQPNPYNCVSPQIGNSTTSCGYGTELATALRNSGEPSTVYNWGWAGEAVTFNNLGYRYSSGVARFIDMINLTANANIDYVLIHEGTNDLGSRSAAAIANGLNAMVEYALSRNVTPIIATITPRTDGRTSRSRHLDLNNRIRSIAAQHDIQVVDLYSALGGFSGFGPYQSGDLLHISNRGYVAMGNAWFAGVQAAEDQNNASAIIPIITLLLEDE